MIDYDRLAAQYARHRTSAHPEVLEAIRTTGAVGPDSAVLEVGCGTGNYIVALAAQTGCRAWGIDPSAQMLAHARARSSTVVFQAGRAERLEFPDARFDLVFSVDVIHHLTDRAAYFREARRVARPGGRVCTVTDSERIIRGRKPLAVYFPETVEVELRRYPPLDRLREEMTRAGLAGIVEHPVERTGRLTDPQPYRDKAYSSLHLIPQEAFERGLRRLEQDLAAGPVSWVARYLLLWGTKGRQTGV